MYEAAVKAVAPAPLTAAALADIDVASDQRCWVFAFGKAAPAMTAGSVEALRRARHDIRGGVMVATAAEPAPFSTIRVGVGDHPLPGSRSLASARMVGELASVVRPRDVAVVLVSGGTTSLIASPVGGVDEEGLTQLFVQLMDAGLDITAMNAVRKRFLRWGAGRLAVALAPARMHVLLMSDVPGDAPADIGSGPCTPDEWSVRDVVESLRGAKLLDQLAPSLREHLNAVIRGMAGETPKPGHPAFAPVSTRVLASNDTARQAAVARAIALGVEAESGNFALVGEASQCGERIAHALLERAAEARPLCIVWGGEPTVRLDGASAAHATGGRAQELALAAARVLHGAANGAARISLLAAGTDGRDGPTDAAGAFVDAHTWPRIADTGADPETALRQHRSHAALDGADALFRRAPTGTNVMDLVIGVVE